MYTCSLDRSVKAWDACSGRLLLSVACPAFLKAVTTDPAEAFLFAGGGGGVIFQVCVVEVLGLVREEGELGETCLVPLAFIYFDLFVLVCVCFL